MAEPHSMKLIYSFRDWEIDLFQRELRLKGVKIPLGNRAFEVLELLVKARGATIDKYDLMSRLWPGAIVEENTLQFHISALRKALRDDRDLLRTAFGKGYRLLGQWESAQDRERDIANPVSPDGNVQTRYSSNLPASVSDLIGRGAALSKICSLLATSRITTLCGPGGIGKTSLALEAAREFSGDFEGDTALVELASVSDPELVASAVATGLDLRLGGYQITPVSIAQAIQTRRVLLLLDNCEHLIDAAAQLAETLMRLCPGVSILATSREPLRIPGEKVFQVPPLDVPTPDDGTTDFLDHSAVKLFIARSGEQMASSLQSETLPTIATICQRLDGIPLAIEFAAARAETLGVLHVAERLHDRFTLLAGTRRTALPRHQTLRATLDWSYELLPENEQHLFRHLAIFPGGFTVAAARAMAGDHDGGFLEERISSLVWKSLVTLVHSADEPRWRLLETTRAYGLEKLAKNQERNAAARQRAKFLCDLFAIFEDVPVVTMRDLPRFIPELDNVRAALDWAFSEQGDKAMGVALAAAYAPVWLHLALVTECRDRLRQAQQSIGVAPELPPKLKTQLLTILGLAENYTGVADETTRSGLMSALEIAENCGDAERELQALYASWSHDFIRGKISASIGFAERISLVATGVMRPTKSSHSGSWEVPITISVIKIRH
ncbi:hypothetical protein ASE04_06220 [Rhizobium sp. Root708]|uniref:ATP-binding protein n=1 Tax=Rhizobium sp. Root708 TaxID=1736592 RepID=UPI0006F36F1E|nr:winged helix-turn-helix domain-containing protein [Rhizobium sp. Root708]KRB55295.1 hypothetical protein ASE04_06220 [Rhizobium sp. Root708]